MIKNFTTKCNTLTTLNILKQSPSQITWHEIFIRTALFVFCLTLWRNEMNLLSIPLLCAAWIMDHGLQKFRQIFQEPLVKAILVLCIVLLLGMLWGDYPDDGHMKWKKYFILLTFIPFLALLNKQRLPWATAALLIGYFSVISIGLYQWIVLEGQGVTALKMSYLSFSAMLGIGIILSVYLAKIANSKIISILFWLFAFALLFIQFNQNARGLLLATLISLFILIFLLYQTEFKKFILIFISLLIIISVLAINSPVFQQRLAQVKHDITLLQQDNYSSSIGYRLAIWDVGIDGITKHPLLGHGTGVPEGYFEDTVITYKNGIYKDLPTFQRTSHYHHDWIEIGMHVGILGILALIFLFWSWYQSFKKHQLPILGAGLISYIFIAGLTDTFLIYSRIPVLLLVITALIISWQKTKDF